MKPTSCTTLLIDFDYRFPRLPIFRRWERQRFEKGLKNFLRLLESQCSIYSNYYRTSTHHGAHYYVYVESEDMRFSDQDKLFLQCLLGDDRLRCLFNFHRLKLGWSWKNSNVFFKENEIHE